MYLGRPLPSEKPCRKCGVVKPLEAFSLSRGAQGTQREVYRSNCKECQAAVARAWFHANKERAKENRHRHALKSTYGITPEEYLAMHAAQGGVCAICGQDEPGAHGRTGTKFKLSVDHCHDSGRVRGLLCQRCNRAIGLLGDDIKLLESAIEYLQKGREYN